MTWQLEHCNFSTVVAYDCKMSITFVTVGRVYCVQPDRVTSNSIKSRSCLGQVFNFKLGSFVSKQGMYTTTPRVENSVRFCPVS
jgi:hypothetical protein